MNIICPVCGNKIKEDNFLRKCIPPINRQEYKLYYCKNCKLKFWFPRKLDFNLYQQEDFLSYCLFHKGAAIDTIPFWQEAFLEHFPLNRGRLLDVGCGSGVFLNRIQKLNKFKFELYGIDFDSKSIQNAKKNYSLKNLFACSLDEFVSYCDKHKIKFDVITFFEVLEHQDDPSKFINSIKKLLKPSGYIVGSVPNSERAFSSLDRKGFTGDFPPHHFLWWSRKSLRYFFNRNDFYDIKFYPTNITNLGYLSTWWETRLSGRAGRRSKKIIKLFFIKDRKLINLPLCDVKKISNSYNLSFLFFLRLIRNVFFLPLAVLSFPIFKLKPRGIYFQARLKEKLY